MRAKVATPYGVKTLLECMARATLLAQPDDISTFLTRYIKNMFRSRTEDGKDVKVVAFDYEEDWGQYSCRLEKIWVGGEFKYLLRFGGEVNRRTRNEVKYSLLNCKCK